MERDLVTFYNWQFLRRNRVYQAMYDEYSSILKSDDDQTRMALLFQSFKLWGMSDFLNYQDENPPRYLIFHFEPVTLWGPLTYDELTKREGPFTELTFFRPPPDGDETSKRFVLITIDLELFKSKKGISFDREIRSLQNQYRKDKGHDDKKKVIRLRADAQRLDRTLAAYDVKVNNPDWTNYQITKELLHLYETPDNKGPDRNSDKVDKDLEAAAKYIRQAPYIPFKFD